MTKRDRPLPDISYLVKEMKRAHVTLSLLWLEYKAANPDGYQYTQICEYYRQEKKKLDVVLRQEHRAGEKLGGLAPAARDLRGHRYAHSR